jgi:hypothetical protein
MTTHTPALSPELSGTERLLLHEIHRQLQDLAARVEALERLFQAQPQQPATATQPPTTGQTTLQQVLPEIKEVAQKVGGFKQLGELASTLGQARP